MITSGPLPWIVQLSTFVPLHHPGDSGDSFSVFYLVLLLIGVIYVWLFWKAFTADRA